MIMTFNRPSLWLAASAALMMTLVEGTPCKQLFAMTDIELFDYAMKKDLGICRIKDARKQHYACNWYVKLDGTGGAGVPLNRDGKGTGCAKDGPGSSCYFARNEYDLTDLQRQSMCTDDYRQNLGAQLRYGLETGMCGICAPSGGGGGDPHFRTFDGTQYSYHGECDLVMARSRHFGNDLGLDLHVRTESMGTWSLISNAALRIGDDIFELDNDGAHYINGHPLALPYDMSGRYSITKKIDKLEKTLETGEIETIERPEFVIDLGNGDEIRLGLHLNMIFVSVRGFLEGTEGMLGVYGTAGMVGRDHQAELHEDAMGSHWQVRDTEAMLFREARLPQYPEACIPPKVEAGRRLSAVSKREMDRAEKACASVDDFSRIFCIEDVLLTGNLNAADAYTFGEAF